MAPQKEAKMVRNSLTDIAPNNSNKNAKRESGEGLQADKSERQKLKPIVTKGTVTKKKRSVMDKFKESFLGESENLGDYIIYDVLVPAFRDTVSEMGFGIIERMFGTGRSRNRSANITRDRGRSYATYTSYNNNNRRDDRRDIDRNPRARHDFENVLYANKWEAEEVLSHMVDIINEYGQVTVRDFYELSDVETNYTDYNYGWLNLREAYVDRDRNNYVIVFPQTRPL